MPRAEQHWYGDVMGGKRSVDLGVGRLGRDGGGGGGGSCAGGGGGGGGSCAGGGGGGSCAGGGGGDSCAGEIGDVIIGPEYLESNEGAESLSGASGRTADIGSQDGHTPSVQSEGGRAAWRSIEGDGLERGVPSNLGAGGCRRCGCGGWREGVAGQLGCTGARGITVLLDLDGDDRTCDEAVGGKPT